ncbi:hypothetical protein ACTFIW_008986 [Dictyostelium discoideum]
MEEFFIEKGNESFRQFLKNNNIDNKTVETIVSKCEMVVTKALQFEKENKSQIRELERILLQENKISSSKIVELCNILGQEKIISSNKIDELYNRLSQEKIISSSKIDELTKQIRILSNKKSESTLEKYKSELNIEERNQIDDILNLSPENYFSKMEKLQLVTMDVSFNKSHYKLSKEFKENIKSISNLKVENNEQLNLPFSLQQHMEKENCKNSLQYENQGTSSLIFSLDYNNLPKIIKWFHRNEEKELEYNTIIDIGKTIKESIPTITNHNREWIEMTPFGILVDNNSATRSLFVKLTKLLEKVHALGYIHRDIRPPNIIVYDSEPYLIDWGFAIKINAEEIYQGTLMTASDRVLDLLIDPSVEKFSLKPSDDLVSLVKTMIVLKENGVEEYIRSENLTHQQLKDYWISIQTSSFYKKFLDMALNCDYQSIIKFLE